MVPRSRVRRAPAVCGVFGGFVAVNVLVILFLFVLVLLRFLVLVLFVLFVLVVLQGWQASFPKSAVLIYSNFGDS